MKFLITLALLFSTAAFAGNGSGNVSNVIGLGGFGATPTVRSYAGIPAGAVVFSVFAGDLVNIVTANAAYPFYKNGSLWQVASGKTATCFNITSYQGAALYWELLSATATFSPNTATASLTSPLYETGSATKYAHFQGGVSNVWAAGPGTYQFPAATPGVWPGMLVNSANAAAIHMDCYEN